MSDTTFGILVVAGVVLGAISALANVVQAVLQFYTMQEIGDMDADADDWYEKKPWRRYKPGEKERIAAKRVMRFMQFQGGYREDPED